MCLTKMPDPKPAPPPPDKDKARLDTEMEQRRMAQTASGRRKNLLSDVANEDFANLGRKKKLGGE